MGDDEVHIGMVILECLQMGSQVIVVCFVGLGHAVGEIDSPGLGFMQGFVDASDDRIRKDGSIEGSDPVDDQVGIQDRLYGFFVGMDRFLVEDAFDIVDERRDIGFAFNDRAVIHLGEQGDILQRRRNDLSFHHQHIRGDPDRFIE